MKIGILVGTRPEIIKMSMIIKLLEEHKYHELFLIHTNQHYSAELDGIFFQELKLPKPNINLNIGSGTHGYQTSVMLKGIEDILIAHHVDHLIIHGDTNTTLSGALAAAKLNIQLSHIEAGLRSHDRKMPEEINRIICDHISDYLFAPTDIQKRILLNEGIKDDKIFVVGNTIVDAVHHNLLLINEQQILREFSVEKNKFILVTLHRAENIDDNYRFKRIFEGINEVAEKFGFPMIFPVHPHTGKKINEQQILLFSNIRKIKPISYLKSITLIKNCLFVLTDSGGIQEEATILKTPCITLRDNTERPESIEVGANVLVGSSPEQIMKEVMKAIKSDRSWNNPFGDGHSSHKIIDIILNKSI